MQRSTNIASSNKGLFGITTVLLLLWGVIYSQLNKFSIVMVEKLFSMPISTPTGSMLQFFIYETPKVLLLLVLVVFAVGIVRTFFTPERTRSLLMGKREVVGNGLAAALGVVTPFCSCSAVPLFIGFVNAGIPLGVTFSFLVSAPMVNEIALALLLAMFGWKIAALYLVTGLTIAFAAGVIIGKLKLERYVEEWVSEIKPVAGLVEDSADEIRQTWNDRIRVGWEAVREIVGKVWPYVILAIGVGAVIHGWIPESALAGMMGKDVWWGVPAAVAIGVPLYGNAAAILPVVSSLLEKGAALGTALAFMMSVVALSLPEMIILRKVLKPPLIGAFIAIVTTGILAVGYLFNFLI